MAYIGAAPGVSSQRLEDTFFATAGQTTFVATAGYVPGNIDVYRNGVKLANGTEFTASNGINVVLTTAAAAGDSVVLLSYIPRGLSDGYTKTEADAKYLTIANPSYTGTLTGGTGVINIGSGQLVKDAAGNLGLGAAPLTWFNPGTVQGPSFSISYVAGVDQTAWATGVYQSTYVGPWLSRGAYRGVLYQHANGGHQWFTNATAPTASGQTVGLTQSLSLDSSGRLYLGQTANSQGFRFEMAGVGGMSGDLAFDTNGSYGEIQTFNNKPLYLNRQGNNVIVNATAGNLLAGTTISGPVGFSVGNSRNISFSESAGQSIFTMFRHGGTGDGVVGSGVAYNSGAEGVYTSSTSGAWARTAIAVGYGAIKFFTASEATVAVGSAVTLTKSMILNGQGNLLLGSDSQVVGGANHRMTLTYPGGGSLYGLGIRALADNTVAVTFANAANSLVGLISVTSTSTTYTTTSDHRLKTNVQPLTGALAFVRQQRPVTYEWISNGLPAKGYIAHWLQEDGAGDCVVGEKDAVDANNNPIYQGVDASFMVAPLNAALNELADMFDQQAALIASLTSRLEALETQ